MKGLILSAAVFVLFVPVSALLCHILHIRRHGKLFFPMMAASAPLYLGLYYMTPPDLGFLGTAWQATHEWVDALTGCLILLLNIHSFIDYFFAFNGGFSTSLMLLLDKKPRTTAELVAEYKGKNGFDKIYGWRIPFLVSKGYAVLENDRTLRLTSRGIRAAKIGIFAKRFLNLGKGG
ncbi:MAG: hypothetical protein NZ740_06230 [Kiritimatiellae bacterium]|nr:hypothetical protein [Kiritimatiellia bacterium]MDW8458692.1 hypothetical protein [Verrucomicrobiota bacterium]